MISLGLYFGLRGHRAEPVPAKIQAQPLSQTEANALAALQVRHADMVAACWSFDAGLPPLAFIFSMAFDATGHEVGRGLSEDHSAPFNQVGTCLTRRFPPELRIPAPGAPVSLQVQLVLP